MMRMQTDRAVPAKRLLVELGDGKRTRCSLIEDPRRGTNGGMWARARHSGEEFAIT